jgi:hypothetical protein
MKDSHQILFRNVKIVGNYPGNANQDGVDWLEEAILSYRAPFSEHQTTFLPCMATGWIQRSRVDHAGT